ncbi:MarR family winged helix-turn-helix transcriptional regulator [Uliginosibacterium gangwonense]|uniref:MarR family winged helix-turn-helix transcriptional regulator n=1 Tax=Uliginosibacterium gangwonense TaxID=392736 RepID=UPI00037A8B7E|nr:MarR family transcriptional regulator [Uliginosibacterium gangwonense]
MSKPHPTKIPAIGEGKRGEQGHIGYLLRQAHAAHRIRMEQALAPLGLTLPQFSVLTMLGAYPGISGADLARLSLLTPQTMSVIVSNLERAELLSRKPHAQHGRIQVIELTEAGRQQLAHSKQAVHQAEEALLSKVSVEEESIIRRWLVSVAKESILT